MTKSCRTPIAIFVATVAFMHAFAAGAANYQDALGHLRQGSFQLARGQLLTLAEQNHVGAQFQLGLMAHLGRGRPQNFLTAQKWYRLAAKAGDANSQNNLGVIYRDGLGMAADPVRAYKWFSLAASQRNVQAVTNLRSLMHDLSKSDILRGQKLAQQYQGEMDRPTQKVAVAVRATKPIAAKAPAREAAELKAPETKTQAAPVKITEAPGQLAKEPSILASIKALIAPLRQDKIVAGKKDPAAVTKRIGKGEYLVQLGLFRNPGNIAKVHAKLKDQGLKAMAEKVDLGGKRYQRLRMGPYASKADAKSMAARVDSILKIRSLVVYHGTSSQAEAASDSKNHL